MKSEKKKETLILNNKTKEKKYQIQYNHDSQKTSKTRPTCSSSEELMTSSMTFTINIY